MRSPITITYNSDWRRSKPSDEPIHQQQEPEVQTEDRSSDPKTIAVPTNVSEHRPSDDQAPTNQSVPVGIDHDKGAVFQSNNDVSAGPGLTSDAHTASTPTPTSTPVGKAASKMNVTWEDTSRKLRKKGYPPTTGNTVTVPPTPDPTPEKTKSSLFSRLSRKASYPPPAIGEPTEDGVGAPPSPPASPGWKHHDSYFPGYTPIYPTTTFADPFARPYLLTPAEIQAQQHAARVGHAVAVHYPMLPPFNEYGAGAAKGQGAWQSGQWGSSNWTGFGLNGERLPDGEGETFGAPMPKGVPLDKPKGAAGGGGGGGDAKQKGGQEGGGGGGAAEALAPDAAAPAAPAGDGAPAQGGAGGGGKKKKK